MRGLSDTLMNDLKNEEGILNPILERVKQDDTLMLAIRKDYINIYYRGGVILDLKGCQGPYKASCDNKFKKLGLQCVNPPSSVGSRPKAQEWVDAFQSLKRVMDYYLSKQREIENEKKSDKKRKVEREFQQLVVRENNCSPIANESEYFITDIEFSDTELETRIDMLAVRWPASKNQRKKSTNLHPALIEMKYGDKALTGDSGMIEHLNTMSALVSDPVKYKKLVEMIEVQFDQLDQLGLLEFNQAKNWSGVKLANEKPEIIFILANHNPRSAILIDILNDPRMNEYASSKTFDLKFNISAFAGYALHTDSMFTLDQLKQFCALLKPPL